MWLTICSRCPSYRYGNDLQSPGQIVVSSTCKAKTNESTTAWSKATPQDVVDTNNQIISSIEDTEYPHCGCETLNMTGIPGEEDGKVFHCDAPYMIGGNTVIDEDNSCQLFCDGDLMWHLFCSQGYWSVQIDSAQDIYCYGKDTIMLLVNNINNIISTSYYYHINTNYHLNTNININ